jgi:hypothetical protein
MNEFLKTTFQIIFSKIIMIMIEFVLRIPVRLERELSSILQTKDKKRIKKVL